MIPFMSTSLVPNITKLAYLFQFGASYFFSLYSLYENIVFHINAAVEPNKTL